MSSASKSVPLLAINAGNSNVQMAFWDGSSFSGLVCRPTASLSLYDIPEGVPCAAANVAGPEIERLLRERGAFLLSPSCKNLSVGLSKMDSSTLGADRLANAIALAATGSLPALCADFGTAITFELLDERANLLGGAILPGRKLQRQALRDHTAKLPMTELRERPQLMPGACTDDAIALGVDLGSVGAVRELLASTKSLFPGRRLRCAACGGDASFFLNAMPGALEPAGQFFTLLGVAKAWESNNP